jgi:hypothetical protein
VVAQAREHATREQELWHRNEELATMREAAARQQQLAAERETELKRKLADQADALDVSAAQAGEVTASAVVSADAVAPRR